ncbi:MAG TPA: hypothetical protein VF881_04885 [Polyangiaceae bacterium]
MDDVWHGGAQPNVIAFSAGADAPSSSSAVHEASACSLEQLDIDASSPGTFCLLGTRTRGTETITR